MSEQELFNGLIATYRELNLKVRPLPEERLTLGRAGNRCATLLFRCATRSCASRRR